MNTNQTLNTDLYQIIRNDDGDLKRDFGHAQLEYEYPSEYYIGRLAQLEAQYLEQKANLEAQKAKVEEFEADNPVEEEVDTTE